MLVPPAAFKLSFIYHHLAMGVLITISALCLSLSVMLISCASDQLLVQKSPKSVQINIPSLPRKIKLDEEAAKMTEVKDLVANKKLEVEASSGSELHQKHESLMHAGKMTWKEEDEGDNKSEYFTMDYHWVRRRRPIHNQHVPIGP